MLAINRPVFLAIHLYSPNKFCGGKENLSQAISQGGEFNHKIMNSLEGK